MIRAELTLIATLEGRNMAPFESAKILLNRAHKHHQEYYAWENKYAAKYRQSATIATDATTGGMLVKAPLLDEPSLYGSVIVFDAISCLRTSLDHAVFDASIMISGKPGPENTKFPFGKDAAAVQKQLTDRPDIPPALHPKLLSYRPYKPENGGDRQLYAMNQLRNAKIHRTLEAMEGDAGWGLGGDIKLAMVLRSGTQAASNLQDPAIVAHIEAGSQMSRKPSIRVKVRFRPGGPFAGEKADDVVEELKQRIGDIVSEIEAEAHRLAPPPAPPTTTKPA
jgi:hypothetical protein